MKEELLKKIEAMITKIPEGESTRYMEMYKVHKEILEKIPNHEKFLNDEIKRVAERSKTQLERTAVIIKTSFNQGYLLGKMRNLQDAWEHSEAKEAFDDINKKLEQRKKDETL